ncbi:M48 family metallopeptidase [Pseudonocardia acaciae]|uniref:M48 family metallopeptidase n=1 Tax=Pseudonocardia acaciae TaxID=551276 RepID=UPI00049175FE|nr:M48 family metallopeptidase [Pseudonocardia acaciae]
MDFFERQRRVRAASRRLVWLFLLAVLAIIAVVDAAVYYGLSLGGQRPGTVVVLLGMVSVATGLVIGVTSCVRTWMLRRAGGGKIARNLGGVYVPEDTTDPKLRRLRNVVEEIAIASGTPVPELYVLRYERGINAFAAGWSASDAAVAVTQGALDRLNRDELQGVVAHEFSHVVNGDMRLNTRLIGIVFGILALAVVGRVLMYGGRGDRKGNNPIALVALAVLMAGYVGVFFGRLIKAAVARQREYLADASAVQFTRQTAGIAGALKKIGGLEEGSKLRHGKAEDVSHMLFGDGSRGVSWFATHPPLAERIKVLEPSFDPAELEELRTRWARRVPSGMDEDRVLGIRPEAVVSAVGDPGVEAYRRAEEILAEIPEPLLERARRVDTVVPLLFGLLVSSDGQRAVIADRHGAPLASAAGGEADAVARLDPALRLPLAQVAFSALRRVERAELERVLGTVSALIHADGTVDVFEYCLSTLLHTELHELLYHRPPWGARPQRLGSARHKVAALLAALAGVGGRDRAAAEAAYRAGLERAHPGHWIPYRPPVPDIGVLDSVWAVLDGLDVRDKAVLVQSVVLVIAHDGAVTVREAELLRTVCAVLHCPLPPMAAVSV